MAVAPLPRDCRLEQVPVDVFAALVEARVGYLQVDADNLPARAIYHHLGFADAYAYHYRTDDPSAG